MFEIWALFNFANTPSIGALIYSMALLEEIKLVV